MNDLWERLAQKKELDAAARAEIEQEFGPRGRKALSAIDDGKVIRYLDFSVVKGRTAEYIVDDDFCTCSDFMYRNRICWHILAVRIAVQTGTIRIVDAWYQDILKNGHR
jgi:predicted nucleic acid-binding Zn finger protein